MRWDRSRFVATSFILISIGSAIYLTAATLNYLDYYPALQSLQHSIHVDNVSVVPGSNFSRIDSLITISNPSSYSGFRIGEAIETMYFGVTDSNSTLSTVRSLSEIQTIGGSLGPNSKVSTNIFIQLSPQDAASLESFTKTYDGRVRANVTLQVEIITFLDPVLGRLSYTTTAQLPLATS